MAEAIIQNASFAISEVGRQAQFVLQCAIEDRSMVGSYLELELPETPLKWMGGNRWSALHLSPGEWLLIGKSGNGRDMTDKTVAHTFQPYFSLVDISDRNKSIDLSGSKAIDLIAGACPLDIEKMAHGDCTRTLFGKITALLWVRHDRFSIVYPRSYHGYMVDIIGELSKDVIGT